MAQHRWVEEDIGQVGEEACTLAVLRCDVTVSRQ